MKIVFDINQKPFLFCDYGSGSAKCGSYVEINHQGAFHWCTYPANHGFCIGLDQVLEIEDDVTHIEKIRHYLARQKEEEPQSASSADGPAGRGLPNKQKATFYVPNKHGIGESKVIQILNSSPSSIGALLTDFIEIINEQESFSTDNFEIHVGLTVESIVSLQKELAVHRNNSVSTNSEIEFYKFAGYKIQVSVDSIDENSFRLKPIVK